ncbi:MAG: galactokinase [Ruminococcus sp.]|uniref:galactokinase n=1 Tax=Ruminococcus sp. TaxID=41978 RepID=UPI0025F63F9B|nr:galactokinase family protein [Ruminococcus sp.]MBR5681895.1 galactokinase [Ruminococcus sp.]
MNLSEFINGISAGKFDEQFQMLYGSADKAVLRARARYLSAAENFSRLYPESGEIRIFTASGRTEIGGNHTDHQHGCVLAAAVSLDIIAMVCFNGEGVIRVKSEGYDAVEVKLSDLKPKKKEKETTAALIRGIAASFREKGVKIGGFDAYMTSDVLSGSGLSSSAAFEVLMGTVINAGFGNESIEAADIARIGQFAENTYFGKASGLMDQLVSAVGGFVSVDFAEPENPDIRHIGFDFERSGYAVCITDTRGSHADCSDEYSAVTAEMKHVAEALGCEFLREADEDEFYAKLPELRKVCNDRELLRAAHFFDENRRAAAEAEALSDGDTEWFFELVNESGTSSAELLQNLYICTDPKDQQIPLAIMLSKRFLKGNGAVRVHGGGFAGTIQAFVPSYLTADYAAEMERVFGEGSCYVLSVRPVGGYELRIMS